MAWRVLVVALACLAVAVTAGPAVTLVADREVVELTGFSTPSGNIGCYIDPGSVRCDIRDRDWAPPPKPADCDLDYGQGVSLSAGRGARFVCAGDTALMAGGALRYGDAITAGSLRCEVSEAGVLCRESRSGHGFSLAREAYQLF